MRPHVLVMSLLVAGCYSPNIPFNPPATKSGKPEALVKGASLDCVRTHVNANMTRNGYFRQDTEDHDVIVGDKAGTRTVYRLAQEPDGVRMMIIDHFKIEAGGEKLTPIPMSAEVNAYLGIAADSIEKVCNPK